MREGIESKPPYFYLISCFAALILAAASYLFYFYHNEYKQRAADNEAGICIETGTVLQGPDLRARVIENFLWQMLKEPYADKYALVNKNIAVINRHVVKDEIIAMIENSSGRQFLRDIENNREAVIFRYDDIYRHMLSLGFFAQLFVSDEVKIRRAPSLIKKMELARPLFNGDFSIVVYGSRYDKCQDGSYFCKILIISGDTVFPNNDGFMVKYGNLSASGNEISYGFIHNNEYRKITKKRANSYMGLSDNAYGRYYFQYISNDFAVGYDDLCSYESRNATPCGFINSDAERQKKIQEIKDEHTYSINNSRANIKFLAASNCGNVLEYLTESGGSGYITANYF